MLINLDHMMHKNNSLLIDRSINSIDPLMQIYIHHRMNALIDGSNINQSLINVEKGKYKSVKERSIYVKHLHIRGRPLIIWAGA